MRYIENKAFPYPVLTRKSDDYTTGAFQPIIEWEAVNSPDASIKLNICIKLSEDALIELIKKGRAEFAIEVHCPQTFTRNIYKISGNNPKKDSNSYNYSETFELRKGCLSGRVITNCYIINKVTLDNYSSSNFHSDYNREKFRFDEKGHVLAIDPPAEHYFDTEPEKPISTFFKLIPDDNVPTGQFKINYEHDKYVGFMLNKKTKSRIELMREQEENINFLLSGFYFPAILEVLYEMANGKEDYGDKHWFNGISNKLMTLDPPVNLGAGSVNPGDLLEAAQQLLSNPLGLMLNQKDQ